MKLSFARWLLPLCVLAVAAGGFYVVKANGPEVPQTKPVDPTPKVSVETLTPIAHPVKIVSYGELRPLETTLISAQVSGEVVSWHPNFVPGGIVKRGEVLFSIESDNYEAAVLQAQASVAQAQSVLIEERARAKVAERQAKSLNKSQVTDLYLRKPQVLSAEAQLKSAQAALKRANRDLDNCNVIAPYDALVTARDLGLGQFITAGAQVAKLNNIENAEVLLPIAGFDSRFLPSNLSGLDATVTQKSTKDLTRKAKIDRDLGVVDSATRMVNIVARVEDPYGLNSGLDAMHFGSYLEVEFTGKTLDNVFKLPQELVSKDQVWVVNDSSELEAHKVVVAREEDRFFYISSGLTVGDKVVTTLPEYPQEGMKVEVLEKSL
ncbi:efflux RND transporter periplasmic adaptor subunit [Vibrio sp. SCSIO 43136]|uniref:efflux RND transporter periplasmic adaptor subunit n=1 Tax=Vibrio sp. SCSIO 43136 TaxID=2819101 RepID=UPI002075E503|nr:efflux RND transporter periplasmic adaptor subunit [Vibrio sp. SCSIO 43136]USD66902.1 efflux RND transporter periplasmic adaptor subunit [Vibrio sp. SCSIO 43136]